MLSFSLGEAIVIEEPARQALLAFDWPGNVRQLRNVLRTLAALCDEGRVGVEDLPGMIRQVRPVVVAQESCERPLDDAECSALLGALEQAHWHMTRTAEQLGISRNTLYRKLRKHGIERRVS